MISVRHLEDRIDTW